MLQQLTHILAPANNISLRVAYPDAEDIRTIEALPILIRQYGITPILIGSTSSIEKKLYEKGLTSHEVEIIDPEQESTILSTLTREYIAIRTAKGDSAENAAVAMKHPLYIAGMLLKNAHVQAAVAGSLSNTADVLRAALRTIGLQQGISSVSSYFLMVFPDGKIWVYADCGVIPLPTAPQLAELAALAADNFAKITAQTPKIAFLSFSTLGSADHASLYHVREALQLLRQSRPDLNADGELQFDAAILPAVAQRKAPDSTVAGEANVFVFPDLNSGNIAYKITERLGGAQAIGPNIQGLAKPYFDLSRGCSPDDIVKSTLLALKTLY